VRLEGTCECRAIRFEVSSSTPFPYRICYCRRCRKTAGSVGAAANILADAGSLRVEGGPPARYEHPVEPVITSFCPTCGTALFLEIRGWPQWVYPFASAVDTELPRPPHLVHVRTDERPAWVPPIGSADDPWYETNTDESMAEWHARLGLDTPD
jgi:hypothetical protein